MTEGLLIIDILSGGKKQHLRYFIAKDWFVRLKFVVKELSLSQKIMITFSGSPYFCVFLIFSYIRHEFFM